MNHWYFIVGAVILLISVILIVICMMQEQKHCPVPATTHFTIRTEERQRKPD